MRRSVEPTLASVHVEFQDAVFAFDGHACPHEDRARKRISGSRICEWTSGSGPINNRRTTTQQRFAD